MCLPLPLWSTELSSLPSPTALCLSGCPVSGLRPHTWDFTCFVPGVPVGPVLSELPLLVPCTWESCPAPVTPGAPTRGPRPHAASTRLWKARAAAWLILTESLRGSAPSPACACPRPALRPRAPALPCPSGRLASAPPRPPGAADQYCTLHGHGQGSDHTLIKPLEYVRKARLDGSTNPLLVIGCLGTHTELL